RSLAGRKRPRTCFLPTAQGDSPDYVVDFYEAFRERSEPSHLKLFGRPRRDIRDFLLAQDVIYVGGGNTANMLVIWHVHGVDSVLREAWEGGIVLVGTELAEAVSSRPAGRAFRVDGDDETPLPVRYLG